MAFTLQTHYSDITGLKHSWIVSSVGLLVQLNFGLRLSLSESQKGK